MMEKMIHTPKIQIGVPITIVSPVDHITFTDVKYSEVAVNGSKLTVNVRDLLLHRPYPQANALVDGTKVSEGLFIFENFAGYDLNIAPLKPDWRSRKGDDRFEPERPMARTTNNSGPFSEFDIGAGYLIHRDRQFEVREWLVRAESLTFTPIRF